MKTKFNLLEQWYKEAFVLSSPYNISQKINRTDVDFIYSTLQKYFGLPFFNIQSGIDKPINKISWLFGLLASDTVFLAIKP